MRPVYLLAVSIVLLVLISGCTKIGDQRSNDTQIPIVSTDSIICTGKVVEPFCYSGELPEKTEKIHTIGNIKITADYPDQVVMGDAFDFQVSFENVGSQNSEVVFTRNTPTIDLKTPEGEESKDLNKYKILGQTEFDGVIKDPAGYKPGHLKLVLNPGERKDFVAKVKAHYANILPGVNQDYLFGFEIVAIDGSDVFKSISFKNIIKFDQGDLCGNHKFPKQVKYCGLDNTIVEPCQDKYDTSICCNGVFYPGANCCSDLDCSSGKCIDGICLEKGKYTENIKPTMRAAGTKKVAIIELKDDADDQCIRQQATGLKEVTDLIEGFYDQKAKELLGKDENFLNFEWTRFGEFKIEHLSDEDRQKKIKELNQQGVSEEEISRVISSYNEDESLKAIKKKCGFEDSDQVVVIDKRSKPRFSGQIQIYLESSSGGFIYSSFIMESSLSLVHEIGHAFGCRDLYLNSGGHLQWAGGLFGQRSSKQKDDFSQGVFDSMNLDVCRGEMGWDDLDKNGVIDILE